MYFLGVDGGNTKTDYLIHKVDGTYVDMLRVGTCSHENFDDGFEGMERAMRSHLSEILNRNKIGVDEIAAAGFGLAGADLPYQIDELKRRVEAIGFKKYGLANDGILGVKAASEKGVGVCAVNGTGTVVVGINEAGEVLQVGGVGWISGDNGGGTYIRDRIIAAMYDFYFRCGEDSEMFPILINLLDAKPQNMLSLIGDYPLLSFNLTEIIKIGAKAAANGDVVAKKIFDSVGIAIGTSVAGCVRRLNIAAPVDIVQVGSIWHKIPYSGMNAAFLKTAEELSGKPCRVIKLESTAAAGAVLWAKEIADKTFPPKEYRNKILRRGI